MAVVSRGGVPDRRPATRRRARQDERVRLTTRQLNRALLDRQLLLHRRPLDVPGAVRRILALQAQEPASPYLALWNRIDGFDAADLDRAFGDGSVVKASLLRMTLHVVHADDHPVVHRAMVANLRASRLGDRRFTDTGLTRDHADEVLPELVAFASSPRTSAEIEAWLEERRGERVERLWWALRMFSPLHHVPTGGPWSFGAKASYVAAQGAGPEAPDEAVRHLIRRYLGAFGPASAQDIAMFATLRKPQYQPALSSLAGELGVYEGPDGTVLYDLPDATVPDEDTLAPPRLLGMWDSSLLAHADRRRVIADEYRPHVIRRNGDTLPALLVDGVVVCVWRPVEGGIEATAFQRLDRAAWTGLEAEARALRVFLADRDPRVYARYGHWWTKGVPSVETRVLRG